ncbi:unnamed protein product [Somion occarium]|uniref:Cytochrome P450 n=1 Tax=Somion occarium TaxID=3059160 RepID=A0ABP1DRB8_9APHY
MTLAVYPALLVALFLVWRYVRKGKAAGSLPPGPPGDPIIGHLRTLPRENYGEKYYEWSKIYGDVFSINILGRPIIILNTVQAASDLFDKRSSTYNDRPYFPMQDLMGWGDTLAFLPFGEKFQLQRKLIQTPLTRPGAAMFRGQQVIQARIMMSKLLKNPKHFEHIAMRYATAIIIEMAYGHRVVSDDDVYVEIAEGINKTITDAGTPGMTPVDVFPILRHVPAWFPGAWFAKVARDAVPVVTKFRNFPFQEVQRQMAEGTATASFLSMHLEELARQGKESPEDINAIKVAAFHLFGAGGDTTFSAILTFIFAMLNYPEIQKKAQKEIDDVIGNDRLPDFSDRESLPYVDAVMWETIRWHQAGPIGMPRRAMQDEIYNGMLIPKGAMVISNMRALTWDENVYAEPHKFWPERYLPKPVGNAEPPPTMIFGHGRRICPGRYLAEASLWIVATHLLTTFNVTRARDAQGREIVPPVEFTSALTTHPKPFECDIKPRSEKAASLIRTAVHGEGLEA